MVLDKAERRAQQRFKNKHRPRGNPKFLRVLMREQMKRMEEMIARYYERLERGQVIEDKTKKALSKDC